MDYKKDTWSQWLGASFDKVQTPIGDRQATFPCIHNWHPMEPLTKYREQIVDDVGQLVKVIDIVFPKYKEMANDQD